MRKFNKKQAKRIKRRLFPKELHKDMDWSDEAIQKFMDWCNKPLIEILNEDARQ